MKNGMQVAIIAAATILMATNAFAGHGKVGLWSVTITTGGDMPKMPDMSKLPPEAQARMKAMGLSMNGHTMTAQHCMTAAEVAADFPDVNGGHAQGCTISKAQHTGHSMSADMICDTGHVKGTGHVSFSFDSDTHYSGELVLSGTANGHPIHEDNKIEGHWLSADCSSAGH